MRNNNLYELGNVGIEAHGTGHDLINNTIGEFDNRDAIGIAIRGDGITLGNGSPLNPPSGGNNFVAPYTGPGTPRNIGIHVDAGRNVGQLSDNTFSGGWPEAIRIESNDQDNPTVSFTVARNTFEDVVNPIIVRGNVENPRIEENDLLIYNSQVPGILLEAVGDLRPVSSLVTLNNIYGAESNEQIGIQLKETSSSLVLDNTIEGVGIGIVEDGAIDSEIMANTIYNPPPSMYRTGYRHTIDCEQRKVIR